MKPPRSADDLKVVPFTVNLKTHIVNDLKTMEKHAHKSVEELVTTALLMFIATHNDYLGKK